MLAVGFPKTISLFLQHFQRHDQFTPHFYIQFIQKFFGWSFTVLHLIKFNDKLIHLFTPHTLSNFIIWQIYHIVKKHLLPHPRIRH